MALAASEHIIVKQEVNRLTTCKIANKIGYTVGTLYLVFETLDELIMHINAYTLNRLHPLMTDDETQNPAQEDYLIRYGSELGEVADSE